MVERAAQVLELALHQQARDGGVQHARHALGEEACARCAVPNASFT
jgi:hypothetical protein